METDEIEIVIGKVPSLNSFYSSRHWTFRKQEKDRCKKEIKAELERYDTKHYSSAKIHIRCNYRYDIDNCIMVSKFFCDSLVDMGFIPDDSKKVIREVKLVVDEDIEKNTAIAKAYLR
jgi:hypothetical protein|tara:strand:+ start:327 stop:680 length:354 start_codon:yes stop_codon:yes gene_type:complete